MSDRIRVAIIGGGITGLTLGYYLAGRDVSHVVLEASARAGGVIRSTRVDGHLLEGGPQRTRLTVGIRQLVEELGLSDTLLTAPPGLPLFVYQGGRLRKVPFSPWDFLRSDIVSLAGKLPLLAEPLTRAADPAESVAAYFTRKVGRELYENLLGPLYGGLYASDPADMVVGLSLGHVLREFGIGRSLLLPLLRRGGSIDPPAACSFTDGMEELPRALQAANTENVLLGVSARAIRKEDGWRVECDGGWIEADHLVLTTPAPVTSRLLADLDPASARSIGALRYNPLAVAHLYSPASGIEGLGYQVALGEKLTTRGVTFNESLFGRTGVFTAYLGGAKAPAVAGWSDAEVASVATREFRLVTGLEAEVIRVTREAMPAWDRSWSSIASLKLPEGLHLAANWQSRPGIPGRLAQARKLADDLAVVGGARTQPPNTRPSRA